MIKPHFLDENTESLDLCSFPRVTYLENVGGEIQIQEADFRAYAIKINLFTYKC